MLIGDEGASLVSRSEAAKSVEARLNVTHGGSHQQCGSHCTSNRYGATAVDVAKRGPVAETGKTGTDYLTYLYLGLLTGSKGERLEPRFVVAASDGETQAVHH